MLIPRLEGPVLITLSENLINQDHWKHAEPGLRAKVPKLSHACEKTTRRSQK